MATTSLDKLHCGPRESRLRCMAKDEATSPWFHLNAEDRDAIQWAFDRISTLEADLKQSRDRESKAWNDASETQKRMEKLRDACCEALR